MNEKIEPSDASEPTGPATPAPAPAAPAAPTPAPAAHAKPVDRMTLHHELEVLKTQASVELKKLHAANTAKEIAGKAIGENGLFYITLIIAIGVGSSIVLDGDKIAAVMGLLSAALVALISMLNGIAGATPKQEKPEFAVINNLIEKLDKLDRKEPPMRVTVEGDKVTVAKGDDTITTSKAN